MINVTRERLKHKGDSKEYYLYVMQNLITHKSMWGYRFGKIGSKAQWKFFNSYTLADANRSVRIKFKQKTSKAEGYSRATFSGIKFETYEFEEFEKVFGEMMQKEQLQLFLSNDVIKYTPEAEETAIALGLKARSPEKVYGGNSNFGIF